MSDKVAAITAGGSGMGAAAARRLAKDGFKVAVLSSSGKGEALGKELGGFGVTGSNQSADDLKRLVDGAMKQWGRIDVLVNSAGHGPRAPILEISDEQWHTGLDVYLMNVIRPTRLVGSGRRVIRKMRATSLPPGPCRVHGSPARIRVHRLALFAERLKEVRTHEGPKAVHHCLRLFNTSFASDTCHGVDPQAPGESGRQGRFRGGDR